VTFASFCSYRNNLTALTPIEMNPDKQQLVIGANNGTPGRPGGRFAGGPARMPKTTHGTRVLHWGMRKLNDGWAGIWMERWNELLADPCSAIVVPVKKSS
jgi:hypothetical protein